MCLQGGANGAHLNDTVTVCNSKYFDGVIPSLQLAQIHRCWINIYAHYKNPVLYALICNMQWYAQEEMKHFVKLSYTTFGQQSALLLEGQPVEKWFVTLCVVTSCFQTQESIHSSKSCLQGADVQSQCVRMRPQWIQHFDLTMTIQRWGSHLPHLPIGILTHVVFEVT